MKRKDFISIQQKSICFIFYNCGSLVKGTGVAICNKSKCVCHKRWGKGSFKTFDIELVTLLQIRNLISMIDFIRSRRRRRREEV